MRLLAILAVCSFVIHAADLPDITLSDPGWKLDEGVRIEHGVLILTGAAGQYRRAVITVPAQAMKERTFQVVGTVKQENIVLGKSPFLAPKFKLYHEDNVKIYTAKNASAGTSDWREFSLTYHAHPPREDTKNYVIEIAMQDCIGTFKVKDISIRFPAVTLEKDTPTPEAIRAQIPPPQMRGFMYGWRPDCAADMRDMRSWGANVIRLRVRPTEIARALGKDADKDRAAVIEAIAGNIREAAKNGLQTVVDLAEGPIIGIPADGSSFWEHPDLADRFCSLWGAIAQGLLPYTNSIYGYDLYNEPNDRSQLPNPPSQWRPIAQKIVRAIRAVDRTTWIIYETGPGSFFSGFENLVPLSDTRVIYSAHFYYPQEFTHQGIVSVAGTDLLHAMAATNVLYPSVIGTTRWDKDRLASMLSAPDEFQRRWHAPVFVGEFSVIRWAHPESAVRWLTDAIALFEERSWTWCYHAFRDYNGWSLEHRDGEYWKSGMPPSERTAGDTERGAVLRAALKKNEHH